MTLCALGLNQNTAPVSIRERLAFPTEKQHIALGDLLSVPEVDEAAILSTCNRTELYCGIKPEHRKIIVDWLAQYRKIDHTEFSPYLYFHTESNSIRHMFRVACGLDSMILGEPQILGQMKSAYHVANAAGALGKDLGKLFQFTFAAAKKVRTDTAIGSSPVSVAFAAVRLAQQIFDDISQQTAILIGAGETVELTARHLHENKIGKLIVANRTFENAHTLASQFGGFAIALAELPDHLANADILVSSTASQLPILGKGSVESAIKSRKHKPMFMVDLAVPRDIEQEVGQLDDVYLYTVDDLENTVEESLHSRREAAKQAEEIIDTEVEHFMTWLRAQDAVTTIRNFRMQAESIRDEALTKALQDLRGDTAAEEVLRLLARTLTNKLVHGPTTQIKQASINERHHLIEAAQEIFQLKDDQ